VKEGRAHIQFEDIKQRFGLVEKSHRIGEIDIKVSQVKRVDEMVAEIYPDAVATHGDAPVWVITWPPAFGLAEYLLLNQPVAGLRVLELGCGTAAPGIALEKAGARVTCTDYDHLALAMARYNARLNGCSSLTTSFLDWHRPNLEGSFDLIVGSEVVYFEKSFKPLLSVLKRYLTPNGRIVLSDQWRPQMMSFLELCAAEGFTSHQFSQTVYLPDHNQPIRITIVEPFT
jgi:predicted nicotinamide N-methyase